MTNSNQPLSRVRRLAISVRGVVQGVGFRPFVYNSALKNNLSGWVMNQSDVVRIEVQGVQQSLDNFLDSLRNAHPRQARIDDIEIHEIACEEKSNEAFEIRTSSTSSAPRPIIPADLATCPECLAEIREPTQRRYHYAFTNCTNCGPRWSIIKQLPYDRPQTSMAGFSMCSECRAEYENPSDRRFHAQPIACPKCGPHLELLDAAGTYIARDEEAIWLSATMILENCVLAMKGLGGFQLIADATSETAVAMLRNRKNRPDRPFAVMMRSLNDVRQYCEVASEEAEALVSHRAPIVLLKKRFVVESANNKVFPIAENVAPGNPYLGVVLPYTPLHHLLMDAVGRAIVCTSGNIAEDPMAIENEEAMNRLHGIADIFLVHDRPIARPVDDSIVRLGPLGFQVLRRARGFAPLPIDLKIPSPTILAFGGHLKNTVALCLGSDCGAHSSRVHEMHQDVDSKVLHSQAEPGNGGNEKKSGCGEEVHFMHPTVVMSPHIGDLDNLLSVQVFRSAIADMIDFFAVKPDVIACDMHPDYASTREAELLAEKWNIPIKQVQHHHAHVAAAMAEHGIEGTVLGLAWDGTGYGTDGTIWGGEALKCEGASFIRIAHLRTFPLPGGNVAMREPRRSALGVLHEFLGEEASRFADIWFKKDETEIIMRILARNINCPRTSSMGRLFDAVAALCGLPKEISFEGQAAMTLEYIADRNEQSAYVIPLHGSESGALIADWEPMIRVILADLVRRLPITAISARFHNALADLAVAIAHSAGLNNVVLTGGCFQNALLTELVYNRLQKAGFSVYIHKEVPPGDGGISLGQIYVAANSYNK